MLYIFHLLFQQKFSFQTHIIFEKEIREDIAEPMLDCPYALQIHGGNNSVLECNFTSPSKYFARKPCILQKHLIGHMYTYIYAPT